jgi:SAM-dependent methyltransferase
MSHAMSDFGQDAWEERYRAAAAVWSGRPNAALVAEAADLPAGSALDIGCGEGADVLWLAGRGWRVTGVDFSATALQRAAEHAAAQGPEVAGRTGWLQADLTGWRPPAEAFDLVSAHYFHLPPEPRRALFAALAAAVAPGGTLLIVGHHADDLHTSMHRPDIPEMFWTAEEVAAELDPARWELVVVETRPRTGTDPEGREVTISDAVLRARRRP